MKNKTLAIYDFDNTLCFSDGVIRITDLHNETNFSMTLSEFDDWREKGYWKQSNRFILNFDDFSCYPINGKLHHSISRFLIRDLANKSTIPALVTGRSELSHPKQWLKDNDIRTEAMVLMCAGGPDKRPCYESLICTFEPSEVIIYEDSFEYIDQLKEVCKKYNLNMMATHILNKENSKVYNFKLMDGNND
jgi:hypothetical protein